MAVVSRVVRHPLLVGLVDRLWYAEPETGGASCVERILPTCQAQIILSPERDDSIFVGPKSRSETIRRRTDRPAFGASFVAGGATTVVGVDAIEVCDETVPLDCLSPIATLADMLTEQPVNDALTRLEEELVASLHSDAVTNASVRAATRAIADGHPAGDVSAVIGRDRRSFVPEFRRVVGVGPKHYERICRFNRTVAAIRRPDAGPLVSIAAQLGFADQSHLSREFEHFAGIGPARLHRDATTTPNHVDSDKIFKT